MNPLGGIFLKNGFEEIERGWITVDADHGGGICEERIFELVAKCADHEEEAV